MKTGSAGWPIAPDYRGGSLVNLMAGLSRAGGGAPQIPPLRLLNGAALEQAHTLVLLVIDGLGDDFLTTTIPAGILAGSRLGAVDSVLPSTTATAVTSFLTGTEPAAHGLTGWFMYLSQAQQVVCTLRATARAGGATLTRAAIAALYGVGGDAGAGGSTRRMHVLQPQALCNTAYTRAYARGAQRHGYRGLRHLSECIQALARTDGPPRYVYAYWPELDRLGHEFGMQGPECRAHLAELDRAVHGLAGALRTTRTVLLVTGDHGFTDVAPGGVLDPTAEPEIAACLDGPLAGEPRFALARARPGMLAELQVRVAARYGEQLRAAPSAVLLQAGYFGVGDARHADLISRLGDCVLLPGDGLMVRDQVPGEGAWRPRGVHGGLSRAELRVPLCVIDA